MIIDKFINDLNYIINTYCSNNNLRIQELYIADSNYSKNGMDTLLQEELKIPVAFFGEDRDVLRGGISVEEDMVLSMVKDISVDEELFLPVAGNKKKVKNGGGQGAKQSSNEPRAKTIRKFWLAFIALAIIILISNFFLKYEKIATYKELFRAKTQLNKAKNEYFSMLDKTQNVNFRIENIKVIESERDIQRKLIGLLEWLYALRTEGMTIKNISYNRGLDYVEITGIVSNIKIINNYLERVNNKTKLSDMVLSKMERITETRYDFVVGVRLK